ncbi:arsenate reductase (glutaredoxin) [Marinomonas algarum]|uniref:Arsenate reductase n=1 Tax=Marinomonas algarum TaxID=2883105 RepID=A0A9X1LCF0_9GAMM|nr:arsenate reductase (glutaredoxin) [Marinomonas algarum]MCB5161427.1 arsenate reductase (glutaredoxin) [Marinomonas algarum]
MTTIYHNPRCSKSRQTLQLLLDNQIKPNIRLYLKDAPSTAELNTLVQQLNIKPQQLMRTKDALYKELALSETMSDDACIEVMHSHPALIERPIVIHNEQAKIGRPPENVLTLFN